MDSISKDYIYTGLWINWTRGSILGATITLVRSSGGLLTAFLALYVGLAGSCFWRNLCYVFHQSRVSGLMKDAMHHQRQVIFRHSNGPASAVWELLYLGWCWRKLAKASLLRTLPFAFMAALNVAIFITAALFTPEVSRAVGDEALIRGGRCGFAEPNEGANNNTKLSGISVLLNKRRVSADSYARACYNRAQYFLECNQYTVPRINWTINTNASCPFASGLCMMGDNAAYEIDTGPIDSHSDLGLNAPQENRIKYRKKMTCAPIYADDFVRRETATKNDPGAIGDNYIRFYLGSAWLHEWTYQFRPTAGVDKFDYDYEFVDSGLSWNPIDKLNRTDADVNLHFLNTNSITYLSPVEDPWFFATEGTNDSEAFVSKDQVRVLGCIEQMQICSAISSKQCTILGSRPQIQDALDDHVIELNPAQVDTTHRVLKDSANRAHLTLIRGGSTLIARDNLFIGFHRGLPKNQWHIEVDHWMAISMAILQQGFVEWAAGSDDLPPGVLFNNSLNGELCKNQKVRHSGDHMSFSLLGVCLILVFGGIIIISSFVMDTVGARLQRRIGRDEQGPQEWIANEKLQLQRIAYERAGQGTWCARTHMIPVTEAGQLFDGLGAYQKIENPSTPSL